MHYDYEVDTDEYINTINDGQQSGTPGTHVDVYWYATDEDNLPDPSYWGVARCMVTMSNNKCDQFRILFNEDRLLSKSASVIGHPVCHEIGHTFGSDDGSQESEGCWPYYEYSTNSDLSQHEIDHLKERY